MACNLYKITLVSLLKPVLFYYSLCTVYLVIIFGAVKRPDTGGYIELFALWAVHLLGFMYIGGVSFLIHINYYLHDKKKALRIDNEHKQFIFYDNNKESVVKYNDVRYIVKIGATKFSRCPWNNMYYYRFVMKKGAPIEVSRLVIENIKKKVDSLRVVSASARFPLMPF